MHIYDKLLSIGYLPAHHEGWWVGAHEELNRLKAQQSMYTIASIPETTLLAIKLLEEELNVLSTA